MKLNGQICDGFPSINQSINQSVICMYTLWKNSCYNIFIICIYTMDTFAWLDYCCRRRRWSTCNHEKPKYSMAKKHTCMDLLWNFFSLFFEWILFAPSYEQLLQKYQDFHEKRVYGMAWHLLIECCTHSAYIRFIQFNLTLDLSYKFQWL